MRQILIVMVHQIVTIVARMIQLKLHQDSVVVVSSIQIPTVIPPQIASITAQKIQARSNPVYVVVVRMMLILITMVHRIVTMVVHLMQLRLIQDSLDVEMTYANARVVAVMLLISS